MSIGLRAVVSLLFLLSGASALVYQVTWLRNLSLIFGTSFEASSIVLASFMTGLCAGGFAFARRAERASRPFALYGLLELGVAVFALAVPMLLRGLDALYTGIAVAQGAVTPGLNVARVALALAILFVPTFLMGGTLPVLTRALVRSHGDFARRLSWLYGINTLGAVFGALGAGFVLIPSLGVWRTQLVAVAANVVIALISLAVERFAPRAGAAAGDGAAPTAAVAHSPGQLRALRLAWLGTAVGGLCALALEVMWTRGISMAVGATTYSFTVMLAAFLTGIWLGSWLHAALPLRRVDPVLQLAVVLCALGVTSALASFWIPRLPELAIRANLGLYGFAPRIRSGTALLMAFVVMLPPCVLMGIAFPLAAEARARLLTGFGRATGDTLGLNTLGAIAGSLLAGFVLIPWLGLQRGMLLIAALYVAYGCVLLVAAAAPARRFAVAAVAGLAGCLALLLPVLAPGWDLHRLGAFQNDHLSYFVDPQGKAQVATRTAGWSLLYYREGRASTVSVVDMGWHRALIVNGKAEASDDPIDSHVQQLLGHVPVLVHPNPKRVFVLGMGTGITLGAVTAHPELEEIVLGEIEPAVLGGRPWFAAVNGDPLGDPRLRVAIQDGRNYLKTTSKRFDVITADPIHPWTSGSVYLYTTEYYQITRDHLAPGGIMCQWLPLTGLSEGDLRSVTATFAGVFPNVSLWQSSYDVLLIGSVEPHAPDFPSIARRVAEPKVRAQLTRIGLEDPINFLAEQGMDDAGTREFAAGAVINSDDNVYIEFSSPLAIGDPDVKSITLKVNRGRTALSEPGREPVQGLDTEGRRRLNAARHAKNQTMLARVLPKGDVRRMEAAIQEVPDYQPARIALARRLVQLGANALDSGRIEIALAQAQAALHAKEDDASAHYLLGSVLLRQEHYDEAIAPLERAAALDPDRWMTYYRLALALSGGGRSADAASSLERAIALNPARPELVTRLAELRAASDGSS